jgi:hypothetical protein
VRGPRVRSLARGCAAAAATLLAARVVLAETAPTHVVVDRALIRFYAPETGGTAEPGFVSERTLAFEARLEAMAERPDGIGDGYQDRHVRAALDRHIGEVLLASLAQKLIAGSAPDKRPADAELARVDQALSAALFERLGGRTRVDAAAAAEGVDAFELGAALRRQALAAWYIDRALSPVLQPTEEQLREAFRTSAHPYRGQSFETARAALARWFVVERVFAAESAFLQGARARVVMVVMP